MPFSHPYRLAAYRSGEKLTDEWDGVTHDYTKKGGIVHSEILLPSHAPPELRERKTLWNNVELFEKNSDAQLARVIEIALPVELDRKSQLALVRTYVNDTFVSGGMCADFALHDKGDGKSHAHILLTLRPLKEDGIWGAKCRKEYDLDEQGQRIRLPSGAFKSHRVNTTDKGNINREVAAQNKLLKEIRARITRLYNWSKGQEKQPEKASILELLKQATQDKPTSTYGKVKALKESAALFHFLQSNGISTMAELHAKITTMQSDYYALRGEIVSA